MRAPRVAVFGLGEAGWRIAADLATGGASVHGYDPAPGPATVGVVRHGDPGQAVHGVDLVLAVTPAADAEAALRQALEEIPRSAVYADLSTSSAEQERRLAAVAGAHGLAFADVALMSAVPGKGIRTPQLVSGPGAQRYVEWLTPFGAAATVVGDNPGDAATRKLLRSVVTKGLAALVIEALRAGEAAGLRDWLWEHLVEEFTGADEAMLLRLLEGTGPHAVRRRLEMQASVELLTELGVEPVMSRATVASLQGVRQDGLPGTPSGGRPLPVKDQQDVPRHPSVSPTRGAAPEHASIEGAVDAGSAGG